MKNLIVLGAGNPDIIRLIEELNDHKKTFDFLGFLDKDENLKDSKIHGYPVLGDDELLKTEFKNCSVAVNIFNSTNLHEKIIDNLKSKFNINSFPNLIHPSVNLKYVNIGEGNIIYESVNFGVNSKIGNHNLFFYKSMVGHETEIGNCCLVANNVSIGARTKIGNKVFFGNSAVINSNITICNEVFIGIGSVVMHSIKESKKVFGNPAKTLNI